MAAAALEAAVELCALGERPRVRGCWHRCMLRSSGAIPGDGRTIHRIEDIWAFHMSHRRSHAMVLPVPTPGNDEMSVFENLDRIKSSQKLYYTITIFSLSRPF